MLVSIAVIPIMAYLNAPSLSTKIGLIRPRPNSPRMGAVVEAEVYTASGSRSGGRGHGNGGNRTNTRGKWKGDDAKVSTALTTNGGIGKHNGKWSMVCKSCGCNTTHTTGYLDKWVADPKSFSLPTTHLFWSKSGKTPPEGGNSGSLIPTLAATTTAASVTSVSLLSSHVGLLIAQYKTNTEDGQFASFLADFKRALN